MAIAGRLNLKKGSPLWFWAFLVLYSAFSLATFRDYGITCDEIDNYANGQNYLRYYFEPWLGDKLDLGGHPVQEEATHNFTYPAFLSLLNIGRSYEGFHLLNLLFGILLFAAVYKVLFRAYGDGRWACAGCLFVFLCPRLLGEIPFNPKDASFAILYFLGLAGIYLIPQKIKGPWFQAFWVGTLIGVTTSLRVLGATLLPVWVLHRLFLRLHRSGDKNLKFWPWFLVEGLQGLLIFLWSQFWMLMLWPYLAEHYFQGWVGIYEASKDYYWNGPILYMGQVIHPADKLWHYLPVWMILTTPLFLLVPFFYSLFAFFKKRDKQVFSLYFLMAAALGLNLALYFVLRPSIYNGLRHYLFLLPVLSVMSAIGFIEFAGKPFPRIVKRTGMALALISGSWTLFQMAQLYPCTYIYFNELAGGLPGAYGKFETEYWGASLKEAALWLSAKAAAEPSTRVRVKSCSASEQMTYYFGKNLEGDNDMKDPDYQVEPANSVILERDRYSTEDIKAKAVHVVQRENVPLFYVLKMK